GGENVYPAEVENVLHQLTAIAEAAVIGIPDPQWGEVGLAIVAVKPGQQLTEVDVFTHCAANLARFKCPRQVRFVTALPRNDTGTSDTEIKIGNVEAYSGPASAYGIIGKTEEAYFKMINDQGGINGRKINWISYDDAYSPPKTVEQIRKLIESDEVFLVFNALGTPTQTAVQKYH